MTGRKIDLSGQVFGRLTALHRSPQSNQHWVCVCSCGGTRSVKTDRLRGGKVISCGCRFRNGDHARTHGMTKSPEYKTWQGIKSRCLNPKNTRFRDYGGRGISVCERWLESFENFLADMGSKPTMAHSIDRVDNDGNYEPINCRWATSKQQAFNKRSSRILATHPSVPV